MRILLFRHAKSSWEHPGLQDHDRPLADRGQRAASAMGAHFANMNLRVDRIISSSATRAWSTALLFQRAFDQLIPMTRHRGLYHADSMEMISIALEEASGDDDARIMLVGHNPGLHDLGRLLCSKGEPNTNASLQEKFPTAALAEFDLPSQALIDAVPGAGRLVRFVRPKELPMAKTLRL